MKTKMKHLAASILIALTATVAADVPLASGGLSVTTASAGKLTQLVQDGHSLLYEYNTFADTGEPGAGFALSGTVTRDVQPQDGGAISSGEFQGDNGTIHWTATSAMNADGVYVTRWALYSDRPFGAVDLLFYADLDIGHANSNAIVSGWPSHAPQLLFGADPDVPSVRWPSHAPQLLMTTNTDTDWGVALGVQGLHHATYLGWTGGQYAHHLITGAGFSAHGALTTWPALPAVSNLFPSVQGWGPADVSAGFGVRLDPGAKVAAFETTVTGAPDGVMPFPDAPAITGGESPNPVEKPDGPQPADVYTGDLLIVTTAEDSGPGSLRALIESAQSGDLVRFDADLTGSVITLGSPIEITQSVLIDGDINGDGAIDIILSGGGQSRILEIAGGIQVMLVRLALEGANGTVDESTEREGGAISNAGTLYMSASAIRGSASDVRGGAIYNTGSVTAKATLFLHNRAGRNGGAIFNDGGNVRLAYSYLVGNESVAGYGGAVLNRRGVTLIESSVMTNNRGNGSGHNLTSWHGDNKLRDVTMHHDGSGRDCEGAGTWDVEDVRDDGSCK
ncbi:hypothetical protein [Thiolapillus sp.]|uniref:hypothetical protein n=1 Tax=Thiolapillus sp. TaxID=2017437 RepID=UPI003AF6978D